MSDKEIIKSTINSTNLLAFVENTIQKTKEKELTFTFVPEVKEAALKVIQHYRNLGFKIETLPEKDESSVFKIYLQDKEV